MKNRIYDTVPKGYGTHSSAPTFTDIPGLGFAPNIASHPVGLDTQVGCGDTDQWDCTIENGVIAMDGANSAMFVSNYGFFNKPHPYEGKEIVVCTTCHNPHSYNVILVTAQTQSRTYRPGTYSTSFFLRAPYAPDRGLSASNEAAQFCRQCHAAMSNEMNGSSAGTIR